MKKDKRDMVMFHKYPHLLYYGMMNKTNSQEPLSWYGIECGFGWYDILNRTFLKIHKLCRQENIHGRVRVVQIKEKFGGLVIYYEFNGVVNHICKEMIAKYIRDAEVEAYITCETCGKPGKLIKKGWWKTICWKCRLKKFIKSINIFK